VLFIDSAIEVLLSGSFVQMFVMDRRGRRRNFKKRGDLESKNWFVEYAWSPTFKAVPICHGQIRRRQWFVTNGARRLCRRIRSWEAHLVGQTSAAAPHAVENHARFFEGAVGSTDLKQL
jgi:hypothetical protein